MNNTTTTISDNIAFVVEVWDNMHNWMDNKRKRKAALAMLAEFESMIALGYWLTDDEELFLAQVSNSIESYC
jgi:hypothetical protein